MPEAIRSLRFEGYLPVKKEQGQKAKLEVSRSFQNDEWLLHYY